LFSALQLAGFEVLLVNGNQTKNLKGKKTDMMDCMWIQQLHSAGLLSGSFLPGAYVEQLRTYYNHRQYLIEQSSKYINKMQKSLRLMNLRLDVVLNDIMGRSGRAIVEAIITGQRDARVLTSLAHARVKKTKEEIAKSLQGEWRQDLLFELKECLYLYDIYQGRLLECDKQFNELLHSKPGTDYAITVPSLSKQRSKHSPGFDVQKLAYAHFGVDLFEIPAVSYNTVLCLLSNMSRQDLQKFPTGKNFVSWLRIAPNNKKTGGKVISSRTPKGKNKIALALRQVANCIGNMKNHPLLAFFKRIAYKKGRAAAITATARKLALIIFNMITRHQPYQPADTQAILQKIKHQQLRNIKQRLSKLNLTQQELDYIFESASLSVTS
jgi:transposase